MKRIAALILACLMCLTLLAGCGSNNSSSAPANSGSSTSGGDSGNDSASGADNSNSEFDEPPVEIWIENLTLGQNMPDLEAVEAAIDEITVPAINVTVKLKNTHIAEHTNSITLAAAGGDKMDIVTTGRNYKLTQMVADGVLLPLEDLMAEYAPILTEKTADVIAGTTVGEHVYAIPGQLYFFGSVGIIYNKDMAKDYNITVPDNLTYADLEAIAPTLKEHGVYLLSKGDGVNAEMHFNMYAPNWYGFGNAMYGMVAKGDANAEVVNIFKTDTYHDFLVNCRQWYENGWVPQDSMTNGVNVRDYMITGQAFCEGGNTNPMQIGTLQPQYDFAIDLKPFADPEPTTDSVQEHGWGIHMNCKRPDKAMQLLEMMYSNEELVNLLSSGIEGKDYVHVSDRIVTYPEGVDVSNVGYTRVFSDFGDIMQIYQWAPVTEDAFDECMEIAHRAVKSPYFGYSFDTSNLSAQIANCNTVINEYLPGLFVGIYSEDQMEQRYKEMIDALDASGINEIIEENQKQLNEWLAKQ